VSLLGAQNDAGIMSLRNALFCLLFCCLAQGGALADTLVNWENGFEVDVPTTWLRQEGGAAGMKLASDDVRMSIEPYSGITQSAQIERLHKETKEQGYEFKSERSYPIHEVPAHEMIFYKDGRYLIYYVLMAGQRGFLITLQSEGTDSAAFRQAQDVIANFRVTPSQVPQR
jgi:hypothetical protein